PLLPRPPCSTLFPYTTLFRSLRLALRWKWVALLVNFAVIPLTVPLLFTIGSEFMPPLYEGSQLYMPTSPPGLSITESTRLLQVQDRKSTRLNSSHVAISYAVF